MKHLTNHSLYLHIHVSHRASFSGPLDAAYHVVSDRASAEGIPGLGWTMDMFVRNCFQ